MIATREGALIVRDAARSDNAALLRVCEACTMRGDVALRIDRAPDFFALNALEGDDWRVGVAVDEHGAIVGCVAAARREVWMNGAPRTVCYVSDLKVIPSARGGGVADELTRYVVDACIALVDATVPALVTILEGNRPMERRAAGPRGLPILSRIATINALAIPLLWERRERVAGFTVRAATERDLEPMAELWQRIAPVRQLTARLDAGTMRAWIDSAPGLAIGDYLLACDAAGRIRGFVGIWDQTRLKQLRVVSYSRRLGAVRRAINFAAPLVGATRLPPAGDALPVVTAVHLAAPDATVLRALLLEAYRGQRARGRAAITLGLDVRDPLIEAVRGLLAQPTFVGAYLTQPTVVAQLDARPVHLETALT